MRSITTTGPTCAEAQVLAQLKIQRAQDLQIYAFREIVPGDVLKRAYQNDLAFIPNEKRKMYFPHLGIL